MLLVGKVKHLEDRGASLWHRPGSSRRKLVENKIDLRGVLDCPFIIMVWLYLLLAGILQYQINYPLDPDTAYHAAIGKLIYKQGILQSLPWTPFSLLSNQYADKELLFHLFFAPLSSLDWINASRTIGTIAGASILITIFAILRSEKVKFAWMWPLVTLSSSVLFLGRFALVRPHLLSITLLLVVLWSAARNRLVILGIASAIFPWAYVAFWQLPLIAIFAIVVSCLISGQKINWKSMVVVLVCMAIGLICHPNLKNLLSVNLMHMEDVLFKASWGGRPSFDLGGELDPYPLTGWIQGLMSNIFMLLAAAVMSWHSRKENYLPMAFSLVGIIFFILTLRTARFAEYFVPFSVAAIALSIQKIESDFLKRVTPVSLLAVTLLWMAWVQPNILEDWRHNPSDMPPPIGSYLEAHIPKGSRIFTPDWSQTGVLMLTLPERFLMVQLDPNFFYLKSPQLYRLWYELCHYPPAKAAKVIKERFECRYVLGRNLPQWKGLYDQLSIEPGVKCMVLTDKWILFDLEPSR